MPDASGNLIEGDPGFLPKGQSLLQSSSLGTQTLTPGTPVTTFTPERVQSQPFSVSPEQTVQEQVRKIVEKDSPLMRQAKLQATQRANQRGLINTSIAQGAAQEAVTAAALPIAQQDAAAYERAATNTSQAENIARITNAGEQNKAFMQAADSVLKADLAKLQADTSLSISDKQTKSAELISQGDNTTKQILMAMQNTADLTKTQLTVDNQLAIAKLDTGSKQSIAALEADNRQLLQTSISAANMFQETVRNIGNIAANDTLTPEAKQTATQTQINLLNEGLKQTAAVASTDRAAVGNLNLSQYFLNVA